MRACVRAPAPVGASACVRVIAHSPVWVQVRACGVGRLRECVRAAVGWGRLRECERAPVGVSVSARLCSCEFVRVLSACGGVWKCVRVCERPRLWGARARLWVQVRACERAFACRGACARLRAPVGCECVRVSAPACGGARSASARACGGEWLSARLWWWWGGGGCERYDLN